jgi:RNase H-fold protein (predicted Holliday junction resolvase)
MQAERVLAVDPGREKCGIAVVDRQQGVLAQAVVPIDQLLDKVTQWAGNYRCRVIVLGDRTARAGALKVLEKLLFEQKIDRIETVDEHQSTLEARDRYWKIHPPTGWRRLIPQGLLFPPCALDDYAAIILAERYFNIM